MWRPGLTQIRVHELASELNVSTQQVLSLLEEFGKKVRGPSTVIGVSDAAKVRGRFRVPRTPTAQPVSAPGSDAAAVPSGVPTEYSQSLFLPPVAPPAAPTVVSSTAAFANPFAVPAADAAPARATPVSPAVPAQLRGVVNRVSPVPPEPPAVQPDHDAVWERRGISKADQEVWLSCGLRPVEAELADRCRAVGIAPADLSMKLSGRTGLQRLRDGEATTSVWARIREAEQQPGRSGTKLTGRFQLS